MTKKAALPATRRGFLKLLGGGIALLPVVGINGCSKEDDSPPAAGSSPGSAPPADPQASPAPAPAPSGGLPRLAEDDPTAQALGYRHAAADVDTARFPQRAAPEAANQLCSNCALFQASAGEQWAGCTLFPGKSVNADGWCSAWVAKS